VRIREREVAEIAMLIHERFGLAKSLMFYLANNARPV
jgi:hypothetical protein